MQAGILGRLRATCGHWLAGVALMASAGAASAYSVAMSPASQSVTQGTQVSVSVTTGDVLADGGLGAFDFGIGYDANILSYASVVFGDLLGSVIVGGALADETGGVGSLFVLQSSDILDSATLLQLQSDLFQMRSDVVLFTLTFNTIGLGTSQLSFDSGTMNDASNTVGPTDLSNILSRGASVTVTENLSVPAPGTLPLVALALLATLTLRRQNAAR